VNNKPNEAVYIINILPVDDQNNGFQKYSLNQNVPFKVRATVTLTLPKKVTVGNHKHARREAFFALNEGAVLCWLNKEGELVKTPILKNRMYIVNSWIPHALQNISNATVYLIEYMDKLVSEDLTEKLNVFV
jgi:mannose-6-phosphate isomerase-like protein (cupin superfamily)